MPPSSSAPPEHGNPEGAPPSKPTGRGRRGFLLVLLPLVLAAALLGSAYRRYHAPGPLPAARAIVVPAGSTAAVAARLARAGVIDQPGLFALAALATSDAGPLHAAELLFPAHASFAEVLSVLRTAPPVEHRLAIPEGLTARQIAALLRHAPGLVGPIHLPAEGWVLPATYDYLYGTKRAAIVARAHAALVRTLAKLWAGRASDLPLATPRQALILASIVERETAVPAERPRIAEVFLNRLRLGMKLQSDPTVIYAVSNGKGVLDRPLTPHDLATPDPYNTYYVPGLPPGPIDAPGIACITAVLHPMQSPDLYFVADGKGGHSFARTLKGQDRNIRLWEQRLRKAPVQPER